MQLAVTVDERAGTLVAVGAIDNLDFTAEDLAEIDGLANEEQINLWAKSSEEA